MVVTGSFHQQVVLSLTPEITIYYNHFTLIRYKCQQKKQMVSENGD